MCVLCISRGIPSFFSSKRKQQPQCKVTLELQRSFDQGATWEFLGIALDEAWHLSYPFVFKYENEVVL
jgi:hypothetical protein